MTPNLQFREDWNKCNQALVRVFTALLVSTGLPSFSPTDARCPLNANPLQTNSILMRKHFREGHAPCNQKSKLRFSISAAKASVRALSSLSQSIHSHSAISSSSVIPLGSLSSSDTQTLSRTCAAVVNLVNQPPSRIMRVGGATGRVNLLPPACSAAACLISGSVSTDNSSCL